MSLENSLKNSYETFGSNVIGFRMYSRSVLEVSTFTRKIFIERCIFDEEAYGVCDCCGFLGQIRYASSRFLDPKDRTPACAGCIILIRRMFNIVRDYGSYRHHPLAWTLTPMEYITPAFDECLRKGCGVIKERFIKKKLLIKEIPLDVDIINIICKMLFDKIKMEKKVSNIYFRSA